MSSSIPPARCRAFGISDNGEEDVSTESASLALTSNLSIKAVSRFRAQFSRDLQSSTANSTDPLTKISDIIEGFGRSSILPRQTREHRLHLAETLSVEGKRNSWKFGGDVLLTWIYNFFPSLSGGEYIFDPIKVNPFTFEIQEGGLELTPLRAYAHQVPHYYLQSFRPGGHTSGHERVRRILAGHDPGLGPPGAEPGRALRPADVHHERTCRRIRCGRMRAASLTTPGTSRRAWGWRTPSGTSGRW